MTVAHTARLLRRVPGVRAADKRTNRMSFAYWSFNPNSGDTGGLVTDDWVTPQRDKLEALRPLLGGGAPMPTQAAAAATDPRLELR